LSEKFEPLLLEREVADLLKLSTRTLRNLRQRGAIGYVMIGSSIRYTNKDVEAFIERHRHERSPSDHRPTKNMSSRSSKSLSRSVTEFEAALEERRSRGLP